MGRRPPSEAAAAPAAEAPAKSRVRDVERGAGRGAALAELMRPAWASVDIDALASNYRALTRGLGGARVMAVVKADAYGHGAVRVARTLEELGADLAAVALLEEAAELRRAGIRLPLLALGTASRPQFPLYRRYRVTPTVSSLAQLAAWREWAAGLPAGERQELHLKVDTGMNRLGVGVGEVAEALAAIRSEPRLSLVGLLSHFAEATDLESPVNPAQEERFAAVVALLTAEERRRAAVHMANSAAALHRPSSRHDLVRLGLSLYGLDPVTRGTGAGGTVTACPAACELAPVMGVSARVVSLRRIEPGARVGYGGRWAAPRPSVVAVVPVGYADGYPWGLGGKGEALVRGRRVPLAGAVSMDMTMLDVTEVAGGPGGPLEVGEEAVLLGRQGSGEVTAAELAGWAGTIPYEVLCRLGQRLPRHYFEDGRLTGVASGLVGD